MEKLEPSHFIDMLEEKKIPIRLGCLSSNGFPCVLSLWYTIIDGKIYCATNKNAKIVKYLQKNNLCGFEIASDSPPYRGIRGKGIVNINPDIGKNILIKLIKKYLGEKGTRLKKLLLENSDKEVALEIVPNQVLYYDYSERMADIR